MTHDEIIAVVAAHRDGNGIECKSKGNFPWRKATSPSWDFCSFDYRIAEPRWRDATIDDLKRAPLKCRVRACDFEDWQESILTGYSKHNVVKWQTSDFFWHTQCQVIDEQE